MAAPVVQTSSTYSSMGPSVAVPVPSGVAANDVIVVIAFVQNYNAPITPPTGFALKDTRNAGTAYSQRVWWKRATGADTGNYTFTFTSGNNWFDTVAIRISGCVTTGDPIEALQSATASAVTTSPAVAVTTLGADRLLIHGIITDNSTNKTPPTGFVEIADTNDDAEASRKSQALQGATGNVSGTWTGSSVSCAVLMALAPPGAAPSFSPGRIGIIPLIGSGVY